MYLRLNNRSPLYQVEYTIEGDDPRQFVEIVKNKVMEGKLMELPFDWRAYFTAGFVLSLYMILVLLILNYFDIEGAAIEILVLSIAAILGSLDDTMHPFNFVGWEL